ncbi:MAG: hypothetical protein ACLTTO_11530 [Lachnospiraceae bacterium]
MSGTEKRTDIRIDDPLISFRYMESLQKLTQHVQKKMEERKAQTLLVTSVLEKEGRSTVAENLALALSMRREGFSVKCRFPEAECVLACR